MKNKLFILFFLVLLAGTMMAQEEADRPQRTPEEEAFKQTTRLVRELGITDSVRFDTIYRMHLKYARWRQKGLSRSENLERMNAIHRELQNLLTEEELKLFMNHPAEDPRHPHGRPMLTSPRPPLPSDSLQTDRQ